MANFAGNTVDAVYSPPLPQHSSVVGPIRSGIGSTIYCKETAAAPPLPAAVIATETANATIAACQSARMQLMVAHFWLAELKSAGGRKGGTGSLWSQDGDCLHVANNVCRALLLCVMGLQDKEKAARAAAATAAATGVATVAAEAAKQAADCVVVPSTQFWDFSGFLAAERSHQQEQQHEQQQQPLVSPSERGQQTMAEMEALRPSVLFGSSRTSGVHELQQQLQQRAVSAPYLTFFELMDATAR